MNDAEIIARYMHDRYEAYAKEEGWNTQKVCQTSFDSLPDANRKVMLLVAADVIKMCKVLTS